MHANGSCDYMQTIQTRLRHWHVGRGLTSRVGLVGRSLGEISLGVGHPGANLHCGTTTKSISPLLVRRPGPEKWGLCEEGSGPNLGENWTQFFCFFIVETNTHCHEKYSLPEKVKPTSIEWIIVYHI
jgi:hypothetical protein